MKQAWFKILVFVAFGLVSLPSQSSLVSPVAFEQIVKEADVVFRGVCEEKRRDVLLHPTTGQPIPIVVYRFRVEEVLKGSLGKTLEFKQYDIHNMREAIQFGVFSEGASFQKGKDYVLFLSAPSPQLEGFRWVVGGGVYGISKGADGQSMAVNPSGAVPYEDFAALVKKALQPEK